MTDSRRAFLRFLAASPLAAQQPEIITDAAEALNVFDFEPAARRKVSDAHWAYMISGVDSDATLRANEEGFRHLQLRPRRLVDATRTDTRWRFWGFESASPIFLCPTGGQKSIHPEGELAVARAAKARGAVQVFSSSASEGIEENNRAAGRPAWYQLYAPASWKATEQVVKRVLDAGCTVIALTVDNTTGRNSETYNRLRPRDLRACAACHQLAPGGRNVVLHRRMYDGIDLEGGSHQNPAMDWAFVDRLRKIVPGKLVIKGIETREDAALAVEHGFDAVWVSNHGGRATETGRSTIEALPEVVEAVRGRVPVFLDGGVRRGTDVFKALALGAAAVGIGRPFLWGLGAFGQRGVERVLEILTAELKLVMGNCGTPRPESITSAYLTKPLWR